MKTTNWMFAAVTVFLLSSVGCQKEQPQGPPQEYYGVKVDWPKLDTSFANAAPDVQNSVASVKRAFRYGLFPQALAELDKLSKNPSLTDDQKKLVSDLIEQTKQVITKTPSPGR